MALPMIMEGTHWWLDFGTLLGFYRDGRIIDYDTDVDISVLEETFDREQFFSNCEKYGFYIRENDKTKDIIRINYSKTNLLHSDVWVWRKKDNNQILSKLPVKWNSDEDKTIPHGILAKGVINNSRISTLGFLNINGVEYPTPHDIEEHLILWYNDWNTKINKYNWLKKTGVV